MVLEKKTSANLPDGETPFIQNAKPQCTIMEYAAGNELEIEWYDLDLESINTFFTSFLL